MARLVGREALWQVLPPGAGAQNPQHAIHYLARIAQRSPALTMARPWEVPLDKRPLFLGQFFRSRHTPVSLIIRRDSEYARAGIALQGIFEMASRTYRKIAFVLIVRQRAQIGAGSCPFSLREKARMRGLNQGIAMNDSPYPNPFPDGEGVRFAPVESFRGRVLILR